MLKQLARALQRAGILLAFVACAKSDRSTTEPLPQPLQPTSTTAVVDIDVNVAKPGRDAISRLTTVGGDQPSTSPIAVPIPEGSEEVVVVGSNLSGQPMVMGAARPNARLSLGPESTSLLLVRMLARALDKRLSSSMIDSVASIQPDLTTLRSRLRDNLLAGRSFADDTLTSRLVAQLALQVAGGVFPQDSIGGTRAAAVEVAGATTGRVISFGAIPVRAEDADGTSIDMVNPSYVEWEVVLQRRAGPILATARLQARSLLNPAHIPRGGSVQTLMGEDGNAFLEVRQTEATRQANRRARVTQVADFIITAISTALGVRFSPAEANAIIDEVAIGLTRELLELPVTSDPNDFLLGVLGVLGGDLVEDVIIPALERAVARIYGSSRAAALIRIAAKSLFGPAATIGRIYSFAQLGASGASLYLINRDVNAYAPSGELLNVLRNVCQRSGTLFDIHGCNNRIIASPVTVTLRVGERASVVGNVVDGTTGMPVPEASVTWTSLSPAVAGVGASSGEITGLTVGNTTIRATAPGGLTADVIVTVIPPPDPVNPSGGNSGVSFGDPHLRTIDSRFYSFQAVGDYILSRSTTPGDNFEVQVRYQPSGSFVSVNEGVAARVAGDVVNLFIRTRGFDVVVNDIVTTNVTALQRSLNNGGTLRIADGDATISWPDGTTVTVSSGGVTLFVPAARLRRVEGLLGNYDGDPVNDLVVRNGAQLDRALSTLYTDFRQSWRVIGGSAASLFRRGTDPFDAAFPRGLRTLADFSPPAVDSARTRCRSAGVVHPETLNACAFDIVATGDDSWAQLAVRFDPSVPQLVVAPALAYVPTLTSRTFVAVTTGLSDPRVRWTATAGLITSTGTSSATFTAPPVTGTYVITATSIQTGTVLGTATVIATPGFTCGGVGSSPLCP